MTQIFRPKIGYWLSQIGALSILLTFAVVIIVLPTVYQLSELGLQAISLVLIYLIIVSFAIMRFLIHSCWLVIDVDPRRLKYRYGFNKFIEIPWSDVIAVWTEPDEKQNINLFLSTQQGTSCIEGFKFKIMPIWYKVETYTDPIAQQTDARAMASEIIWDNLRKSLENQLTQRPLRITTHRSTKRLGWGGLLFWSIPMTLSFTQGNFFMALFFLGFAALAVTLILSSNKIEMDAEAVTNIKWSGRYRMKWDQIQTVMIDHRQNAYIVFNGNGKQLAIAGPSNWSGSDLENMVHWLNMQLEEHNVKTEPASFISFKRSKNTRL